MFALTFVEILIWVALGWTLLGAVTLVAMIWHDHRKGQVW